ncbi:response regulator [Symplocastrum sp. BBK-W-15]|uniref:Response regulator n=2 Tax=Limnofasciculus TaxID=3064905 RepID=A0AAE3KS73_9CYAN|nr:response regulator [Limnofasciculus baicalensis]MCP2732373.1 response regulator [Limnofasciculus baicalensis BBK-W-15]
MTSYRTSPRLNPLSLLAQLSSRQANGCLQISSSSTSWSIYLEQGKLIYASDSLDPFERLDRHLRQLSRQIPTLVSAVRVQVRLLFESDLGSQSSTTPDYRAICWLVEQQYLNLSQAATLIEELAEDVIRSLLAVKEGTHQLIPQDQFEELPKFCRLELRTLVERCHEQLRRIQPTEPTNSNNNNNNNYQNQPDTSVQNGRSPQLESTQKPLQNSQSPPLTKGSNPPGITNNMGTKKKTTYTIACIDDSATVLNAINSFLDDKSFSVVMINDPVRALMQVVRIKPDLILLDVEMPNLDGYELCSLLRKHSLFKTTPIVMVTGNTGFLDRAKAKLVRSSGYLTKPFNQSELLKIVFKHLS